MKLLKLSLVAVVLLTSIGTLTYSARAESVRADSQMSAIANLQAQITALMAQLATLRGDVPPTPSPNPSACIDLSYDLSLGSRDIITNGDVTRLQQFLGVKATGYFGSITKKAVQKWQSAYGIASYGSSDTWGDVGSATRAAMACSKELDFKSTLGITSSLPAQGSVDVKLHMPKKYDGKYIVYLINPVKTSIPVGSGNLLGLNYYFHGSNQGVFSAHLALSSAHEGFADNPGGVHWFPLPLGKYKITAVVYPSSPFKPGTEMEYMDIGTEPGSLEIIDSQIFDLVNGDTSFSPTATIEQSSLTQTSNAFSIIGSATNVKNVTTFIVPTNFPYRDYARVAGSLGKDGIYVVKATVSREGWAARFTGANSLNVTSGQLMALVYDTSTQNLLAEGVLSLVKQNSATTATIDPTSLVTTSVAPTITGRFTGNPVPRITVTDAQGAVRFSISQEDTRFQMAAYACYGCNGGSWSAHLVQIGGLASYLPNGQYTVTFSDVANRNYPVVLTTGTLTINISNPRQAVADSILQMAGGLILKDYRYDLNNDNRITSADATLYLRGQDPIFTTMIPECGTAQVNRGQNGQQFACVCPASFARGQVWGGFLATMTNGNPDTLYTDDSNICTAALQADNVNANGGFMNYTILPGQSSYIGSTRNGVTSQSWDAWPGSFRIWIKG